MDSLQHMEKSVIKVVEVVWEFGRGQWVLKYWERTGEGADDRAGGRHVSFSPRCCHHPIWSGTNLLCMPDFSSEPSCHRMGLPFPVTINSLLCVLPLAPVAEVAIPVGRSRDQPVRLLWEKEQAKSAMHPLSLSQAGFQVPTGWLCLCHADLEDRLWTSLPLEEHGGSAAAGSRGASCTGCAREPHNCPRSSDPVCFVCWTPLGLMRLQWGEPARAVWGLDPLVCQVCLVLPAGDFHRLLCWF